MSAGACRRAPRCRDASLPPCGGGHDGGCNESETGGGSAEKTLREATRRIRVLNLHEHRTALPRRTPACPGSVFKCARRVDPTCGGGGHKQRPRARGDIATSRVATSRVRYRSPRNSRIAAAVACASFLSAAGSAHAAPPRVISMVLQTSMPDARSTPASTSIWATSASGSSSGLSAQNRSLRLHHRLAGVLVEGELGRA